MYEAFDTLLTTPTWRDRDSSDEERFYLALDKVVWKDDFEPEDLRQYLRDKAKVPAADEDSEAASAIERYAQDAWAVVDFIKYSKVHK
jgi:hypothetical protein